MSCTNQSLISGCGSTLLRLDWNPLAVPINGFVMPLIAVVTLVNNALVLAVLLRRQMRSPTNALLTALAVSDTLTSVSPTPCFVYFYTLGQRYLDWVPYSWCFAYFCLTDYLPTVFHTASIWLTTCLAVQRYACVCCRVDSKVRQWLCSMRGAVCVVLAVYMAAVSSQVCRLGELTFSAVRVKSLINHDVEEDLNSTTVVEVTACRYELAPFVARHEIVYYNVYYWSRVIFIHMIPCFALVLLNTSLIRAIRAARHYRRQLSQTMMMLTTRRPTAIVNETGASPCEVRLLSSPVNAVSRPPRQSTTLAGVLGDSSTKATVMLIIVVGVFLLVEVPLSSTLEDFEGEPDVEVPLSALLLLVIVENTFHVDLFSDTTRHTAALFVNCCIAITYPLNFYVYCTMSERFRRMFCALFGNLDHPPPIASAAAPAVV